MKLYDTTTNLLELEDLLKTDEDGNPIELSEEDKQAGLALFEELEGNYTQKIESICKLRANLQALIAAISSEQDRLAKRKKASENKVKFLQWIMEQSLRRLGAKKITAGTFTVSMQKNPPSVYISNEQLLPADYWRVIPEERSPDKKLILAAITAGNDIPGAMLSQGESVRIK